MFLEGRQLVLLAYAWLVMLLALSITGCIASYALTGLHFIVLVNSAAGVGNTNEQLSSRVVDSILRAAEQETSKVGLPRRVAEPT
jgi:hypothetical protein